MEANGDKTNPTSQIQGFYIFNSKFGNDSDNEMGKVLYCYPGDTHQDKQLKHIGLCEAIVKFAETFNTDVPCESLHTLKSRHVYYQAEPGYWFILIISIPSVSKLNADGVECIEYLDGDVQDNVFRAVLKKFYEKFVMLNDHFESIVELQGVKELKLRMKKPYDSWIQKIDAHHCGVAEIFRGLQFLPLSRDVFLQIQCFINNFLLEWPQIKYVILQQREKLLWSGVDQSYIQLMYDYLVNDLLSQHFLAGSDQQSTFGIILKRMSHVMLGQQPLDPVPPLGLDSKNSRRPSFSAVTTSYYEDDDNSSYMTASSQTLNGRGHILWQKLHMVIYKAEQTYLTMLIPDSVELDRQLCTKIEAFLNLNFTPIAKDLGKTLRGNSNGSSTLPGILSSSSEPLNTKFVYFNNLNFAEKLCPGYQCDLDSYKLLADLKMDLSKVNENGEIITKMVSDNWIVAKVSNRREFYAIFNHKNSNLLEIDEEMRQLTEAHLTNIFFQE